MSETQERDERVTFSSIFIHWNPDFYMNLSNSFSKREILCWPFCVLHLAFSVVATLGNLAGFRPRLSQLHRSSAVTLQRKIRDCSQSKCLTIC